MKTSTGAPSANAARYEKIKRALATYPGVAVGASRGFGGGALTVGGKIFAMLASRDRFVVKLPRARVDALVAAGKGGRFDPGRGLLMKEWLEVGAGGPDEWLALAREACAFVAGKS